MWKTKSHITDLTSTSIAKVLDFIKKTTAGARRFRTASAVCGRAQQSNEKRR
jgi:hypothetical protein